MSDITIKLLKGRSTFTLSLSPTSSFSVLRTLAEAETGSTSGGLRLLFRGRCPSDNTTLQSAGVIDGSTLMALPTAKQRKLDQETARQTRSSNKQQPPQSVNHTNKEPPAASAAPRIGGDEQVQGAYFVMVRHGKRLWRINIDPQATVGMLRARVATLDGVEVGVREVKLLSKGGFLHDDAKQVSQLGIKQGGEILVMFGGAVHDRRDNKLEMNRVEEEIGQLEHRMEQVRRTRRARLMDNSAWSVERGGLLESMNRLRENVNVIVTGSDTKTTLLKRLNDVERCICELD